MLEQRERRTFLTPETWTLCLTGQHKVSQKISTIFPNNSLGMPDFLFYSARREHIYFGSYRTTLPNHLTQGSPHSLNVLTLGFARRSNKAWMNLKRSSLHIAIYDYISPETTRFIMRWNVAGAFLNPNSLTVHEYNCGFTHELCAVFEVRTCCTLEKPTSDVFTAMMNFLVSGTGAACRRQDTWLPSAGWEFTGHELISHGCSCTSHWLCLKLQHIC